jgi:hypothetical protein
MPRPARCSVLAAVTGPPRYRCVVLGAATFTQAASGFFTQGIGALGVHLQRDLNLSTAQLGLLLSAAGLVPLIGLPVAGELLDRFDERWVVGIGACVVASALGLGSLAPGYAALLGALLLVGAGYSTAQPGGSKSVASWFDTGRRGLAMGIRQAGLPLGGPGGGGGRRRGGGRRAAGPHARRRPAALHRRGFRLAVGTGGRRAPRVPGSRDLPVPLPFATPSGPLPRQGSPPGRPATDAPRTLHGADHAVRGEPDLGAVRPARPDRAVPARPGDPRRSTRSPASWFCPCSACSRTSPTASHPPGASWW